jgi:hypothetical protein
MDDPVPDLDAVPFSVGALVSVTNVVAVTDGTASSNCQSAVVSARAGHTAKPPPNKNTIVFLIVFLMTHSFLVVLSFHSTPPLTRHLVVSFRSASG